MLQTIQFSVPPSAATQDFQAVRNRSSKKQKGPWRQEKYNPSNEHTLSAFQLPGITRFKVFAYLPPAALSGKANVITPTEQTANLSSKEAD